MKLLIQLCTAVILFSSATMQAQNFDEYKEMTGVVSVNINKNLFKLMSQLDLETEEEEAQQMIEMINQLESIQIFTTSNQAAAASLNKDATAYMKSQKLEELMNINDEDGKKVRFYFRPGATDEMVKQLFMHINDVEETIVIMIEGNVNLAQIGKIAKQFNLPGSTNFDELEKNK
jgi:hypothetical protein